MRVTSVRAERVAAERTLDRLIDQLEAEADDRRLDARPGQERGQSVQLPHLPGRIPVRGIFQRVRDAEQEVGDGHVAADRIGVVGHCWGGRVAWLAACHVPQLAACGIFYGGRIKRAMGEGSPPPIDLAAQINCKVAGFWGNDDQNPPSADVDDYAAALTAANVPHEFHRYEGAGHGFQDFTNEERYQPEAAENAWSKLLVFLGEELGS